MQLQKHSNKVNNKEYFKYVIVVRGGIIRKLGWKEGDELEAEAKNDELLIMRENKSRAELAGKEWERAK
ncbi:AbrB/MazE/SpoVT family DNA-binding domain-containing protein [Candidatus Woesearchaeota archaeon]|nr:AbrB/MazE/SpoVT family DNA-binding domain-containing protein [Candidatus Woesearchaeota archaeon]